MYKLAREAKKGHTSNLPNLVFGKRMLAGVGVAVLIFGSASVYGGVFGLRIERKSEMQKEVKPSSYEMPNTVHEIAPGTIVLEENHDEDSDLSSFLDNNINSDRVDCEYSDSPLEESKPNDIKIDSRDIRVLEITDFEDKKHLESLIVYSKGDRDVTFDKQTIIKRFVDVIDLTEYPLDSAYMAKYTLYGVVDEETHCINYECGVNIEMDGDKINLRYSTWTVTTPSANYTVEKRSIEKIVFSYLDNNILSCNSTFLVDEEHTTITDNQKNTVIDEDFSSIQAIMYGLDGYSDKTSFTLDELRNLEVKLNENSEIYANSKKLIKNG